MTDIRAILLQDAFTQPAVTTLTELTPEHVAKQLGVEPISLRALIHRVEGGDELYIGVATGAVYSLQHCPAHHITLRGPTIAIQLKDWGRTLAEAVDLQGPVVDFWLAPEEGNFELAPMPPGWTAETPIPSCNRKGIAEAIDRAREQSSSSSSQQPRISTLDIFKALQGPGAEPTEEQFAAWRMRRYFENYVGDMPPAGQLTELHIPVLASPNHTAGIGAYMLATASWYIDYIMNLEKQGKLEPEQAVGFIEQARNAAKALEPFHRKEDEQHCEPLLATDLRDTVSYAVLSAAEGDDPRGQF